MMTKKLVLLAVAFLFLTAYASPADALWWMVFHKPAFKGKVVDAETKSPIEGAVVVAVYSKETASFPHHYSTTIDVRETLTGKDGTFLIPSYTTVIQPLSVENPMQFIIFKSGYGSYPEKSLDNQTTLGRLGMPLDVIEEFFSREETGVEGEIVRKDVGEKYKVVFGIVELPRLKTREERVENLPSIPGPGIPARKMRLLIKASNSERQALGFGQEQFPE